MILHLDFETRSTLDLRAVGLHTYARHPTTGIWCLAYAFDDEPVELWTPSELLPERVLRHIADGGEVWAHNVAFEMEIWNHKMPEFIDLEVEQCHCTMSMAYAMALPGSLDDAAAALGLAQQKDAAGHRLMLQMAAPRTVQPLVWWDTPDRLGRLYAYCRQDVEVERALHKRLLPLSKAERKVWLMDQRINQRGIGVDTASAVKAIDLVSSEQERLACEIRNITDGFVGAPTETARLAEWVRSRGVPVEGVAKAEVLDTLRLESIPGEVRQALLVRQEAGRASPAKLRRMVEAVDAMGRLRGIMQYHGAGTGRWAGRRVQPHNFPRPTPSVKKLIASAFDILNSLPPAEAIALIDLTIGPPMDVVACLLRGMLIAALGHKLIAGDFANIEGRGLAWLAGEQWKLDAFAAFDLGIGPDIYKLTYSRSFNVPIENVTDAQRQIGKVEELALGYQGGVGAFQTMAKGYAVKMPDDEADLVKNLWREAHPNIVKYWYDLERAAVSAAQTPGAMFAAGPEGRKVVYRVKGSFLWCRLPSGRVLCYPYPELWRQAWVRFDNNASRSVVGRDDLHIQRSAEAFARSAEAFARENRIAVKKISDSKAVLTYKTVPDPNKKDKLVPDATNSRRWARVATYGGKLAENVTQAIARDLLAEAMLRLEDVGLPIVLHVHDEAVVEVDEKADEIRHVEAVMSIVPTWAAGLPIAVECFEGKRYRK